MGESLPFKGRARVGMGNSLPFKGRAGVGMGLSKHRGIKWPSP